MKAWNIPTAGLPLHMECMAHVLQEELPEEVWENAREYVEAGVLSLK